MRHFDFVSIGTNDLIQYTLAIDRADEAVAHLYDPWHPAVLQLIAQTIAEATRRQARVSVCGEMAGDPAFTELLLAMGLRLLDASVADRGSETAHPPRRSQTTRGSTLAHAAERRTDAGFWAGARDPREITRDVGLEAP